MTPSSRHAGMNNAILFSDLAAVESNDGCESAGTSAHTNFFRAARARSANQKYKEQRSRKRSSRPLASTQMAKGARMPAASRSSQGMRLLGRESLSGCHRDATKYRREKQSLR